jgi:hypothetical protein
MAVNFSSFDPSKSLSNSTVHLAKLVPSSTKFSKINVVKSHPLVWLINNNGLLIEITFPNKKNIIKAEKQWKKKC